jgi:quercetin dioxygenase-like cupin family protein
LTEVKAPEGVLWQSAGMQEQPIIQPDQAVVLALEEETRFAPNGIVSRTLLRLPQARGVLFGFAAGQELTEHTSTQHALILILSGRCEFVLAGKTHALQAGHLVYMPPGLPHAVRATEAFSMLLLLFPPTSSTREILQPLRSAQETGSGQSAPGQGHC